MFIDEYSLALAHLITDAFNASGAGALAFPHRSVAQHVADAVFYALTTTGEWPPKPFDLRITEQSAGAGARTTWAVVLQTRETAAQEG
jgi:hypothetical protein